MRRAGIDLGGAAAKYAAVSRNALSDALAWRSGLVLGLGASAGRVLMALALWSAVFSGRREIGGMGLAAVASYYLVAVFVAQIDRSSSMVEVFAREIRAGEFAKYLARPVDPLAWFLASCLGRSAFQAALTVVATATCAVAFSEFLVPPDPAGLLAASVVAASGLLSLALINFMTSILAFAFQDVASFNIGKNCLVEFLSGSLLPLALLPGWARRVLELTPFPALASLPAEFVLGPGRGGRGLEELPTVLLGLALWNLALFIAARRAFAALSSRYEEAGS